MHRLSSAAVAELRRLAEVEQVYYLVDGQVRLVVDSLPGRAVVGVARQGDLLWVVLDLDKPDPYHHLVRLMNTWPLDDPVQMESMGGQGIDDLAELLTPLSFHVDPGGEEG
jgi:hypothetical protein